MGIEKSTFITLSCDVCERKEEMSDATFKALNHGWGILQCIMVAEVNGPHVMQIHGKWLCPPCIGQVSDLLSKLTRTKGTLK